MWHFRRWFSDGLCSAGLAAALSDPRGPLQPKKFYVSMTLVFKKI